MIKRISASTPTSVAARCGARSVGRCAAKSIDFDRAAVAASRPAAPAACRPAANEESTRPRAHLMYEMGSLVSWLSGDSVPRPNRQSRLGAPPLGLGPRPQPGLRLTRWLLGELLRVLLDDAVAQHVGEHEHMLVTLVVGLDVRSPVLLQPGDHFG